MSNKYRYAFTAACLLTIMACGVGAQAIPATQTSIPPTDTPTPTVTMTTVPTDTIVPTDTVAPTETPQVATIPPLLSAVPGIQMTLTQVYLTPGAEQTIVAQQTGMAATSSADLKNSNVTQLLNQCPDPSDPPQQAWVDIPVMSQATAGQEVKTLIGSYYCFRAPVTGADVESFYKQNLQPPNWLLQSDTDGAMQFFGFSQKGIQLLFVVYAPSAKNDLLVAINVTIPMSIPTLKP